MILYKLLPMKIDEVSHVCYVSYSVITLQNWYLAYCGPTRSRDHKTVDCECLFIQQLASITWLHSHLLFSYF